MIQQKDYFTPPPSLTTILLSCHNSLSAANISLCRHTPPPTFPYLPSPPAPASEPSNTNSALVDEDVQPSPGANRHADITLHQSSLVRAVDSTGPSASRAFPVLLPPAVPSRMFAHWLLPSFSTFPSYFIVPYL
ncbi:hypothetical protein AZE42_00730 [Rhizopogon vesiculosus]|uniref:Uncharacterized protein n=1 Tax=Rhizopogon vesiculosus TaxID=180088 RepID=A0A1J8QY78_9AGAM|nr:hypothetical protein AZE42_00730 [Rhizopogon vesiculosus]